MTAIPSLGAYLQRLTEARAPVIERLQPGATRAEILKLESLENTVLPNEAFDFWSFVNGVEDVEPWDHTILFPIISTARSTNEAIEIDRVQAKLRNEVAVSREVDLKFWPTGMIALMGEDGNGEFLNCRPNSPTYGAVYHRSVAEEPLVRISNSLESYLKTLVAAYDAGMVQVLKADEHEYNAGTVYTDISRFHELGHKMNPDCPGFEPFPRPESNGPDWL